MIIWHADDMPEHIESMFDDCEYASDISSVLRSVSKSEAGWLARFARERAQQESEPWPTRSQLLLIRVSSSGSRAVCDHHQ